MIGTRPSRRGGAVDVEFSHQLGERLVGQCSSSYRTWEGQALAAAGAPGFGEHFERSGWRRHAVSCLGLGPLGWDGPHRCVNVELGPVRASYLARAGCGEGEELQAQLDRHAGLRRPDLLEGRSDLAVVQGPVVLGFVGVSW